MTTTRKPINITTYYYKVKVAKSIFITGNGKETIISTHTPLEIGKQYFGLPGSRSDHAAGVSSLPYHSMDENYNFHEENITPVQLEGSSIDKDDVNGVAVDVIEVMSLERSFDLMSNLPYNKENRKNHFITDSYNWDDRDILAKVWELDGKKVPTRAGDLRR